MNRLGPVLAFSCLGVLLAACSSSSDGGPTFASGSAGVGGVTSSEAGTVGAGQTGKAGSGAGSSGVSGSGGAAGSAGGTSPSKTGQVVFSAYVASQPHLIASFSDLPSEAGQHCVDTDLDGCSITHCDDSAPVVPAIRPTAGTITLTSPNVSGSAVLVPGADGSYGSPKATFSTIFVGEEVISFRASGGAVPAFENELTMPLALLRSEPYVDNSDTHTRLQIPSTRDLKLTWTRGAPDVWLILDARGARLDGKPGTASLYCAFPSEAGTGTVRSSLLQQLEQEVLMRNLTVLIKRTTVGDYAVTLATTFEVYDESKSFPVTSTLQLHDP